jgi:nicotinate-nucleotide pyrophosphorylase (carboxylating)
VSIPTSDRAGAVPPAASAGRPAALDLDLVDDVVLRALAEDARDPRTGRAGADVTSENVLGPDVRARGRLVAKEHGRLAGIDVFCRVFERCDPEVRIERRARDGDSLAPRQVLCVVEGRARALLLAERTALNLVQRMSGTATLTARYAEALSAAGSRARVLDTRKTTPGLRALEKYAVRCGGGENHRFGLYDEAMVKNNHVDLADRPLAEVVAALRRSLGPSVRITAEARDESEALAGVDGGADVILLDNMSPDAMAPLCGKLRARARARGRPIEIEASGGIELDNVVLVARSGVDRVSIGALTHSAPALDLSLYLEPLARAGSRPEEPR